MTISRRSRCLGLAIGALLLCAQPAAATWTLVAHTKSGNADGTTGPFKAPTGAGTVVTTGAELYACAASYYSTSAGDPASGDLTDVSGNSYTRLTPQTSAGDVKNKIVWFYKLSPTTSAVEQWTLVDVGNHTDNVGLTCLAFSGVGASPTVTSSSSGATSSTPSAGSLGASGNLVLTAVADYTVTVTSIDSSFSITDQSNYTAANNIGIAAAWQNLSGGVSGAVNPTWTLSGAPTASAVQAMSVTGTSSGASGPCTRSLLGVGCHE